jgi:hypothetical protein
MDKAKELQDLLDEIQTLKQLQHKNKTYTLWRHKMDDTLGELFTRNSVEYRRINSHIWSYNRGASDEEKQAKYLEGLDIYQTDLESIIQRQSIKKRFGVQHRFIKIRKTFKSIWSWIKSHITISAVIPIILILFTLLAANWDTVNENLENAINFLQDYLIRP